MKTNTNSHQVSRLHNFS